MKRILLFALAALLLAGCGKKHVAEPGWSGLEQMELRGKVKRIVEINNTIANPEWMAFNDDGFGEVVFLDYYLSLLAYCEAEGLDFEVALSDEPEYFQYYYEGNDIDGYAYKVYDFDENGDLVRESGYQEDMNGSPAELETNTYDERHHILRTDHFNSNQALTYYREYEYNADGFETREYYRPSSGDSFEYLFTYDADNNCIHRDFYHKGELFQTGETVYNSSGQVIEEYSQGEEFSNKYTYDYYRKGKLKGKESERRSYDEDGNIDNVKYTVYSDDLTERWEIYVNAGGDTNYVYYYKIDKYGNDIYEAYYDKNDELPSTVSSWEYDKHGNMTFAEWNGVEPTDYYCSASEYDEKDRDISRTWFSLDQGALLMRIETVYGTNDRVQSIETYVQVVNLDNPEDSTDEYLTRREVYSYDQTGNWIKHETYNVDVNGDELLMRMETREIEYY